MKKYMMFIVGLSATDAAYQPWMDYIRNYMQTRLSGVTVLSGRWDHDEYTNILKAGLTPSDSLTLVGHSFGGRKAVNVAMQFNDDLLHHTTNLVLIDPVDWDHNSGPNLGFTLTANVKKAWAFYRGATATPWSGPILKSPGEFYNKRYVAVTSDPHGEYVWQGETLAAIKSAIG